MSSEPRTTRSNMMRQVVVFIAAFFVSILCLGVVFLYMPWSVLQNFLLTLLGLQGAPDVHRIVGGDWHMSRPLPPALVYAIIAVGLVLAFMNFHPRLSMRTSVRIGTCLCRLAMVAVLLVILCGLEWQARLETNQMQQWVVLMDDSASMSTRDVEERERFQAAADDLDRLRQAASGKVNLEVRTFSGAAFGEEAGQGPTLYADAVARAALSRSRPDRLVILSDGRDSEGRDLSRLGEDLQARDIRLSMKLYGSESPPVDRGIAAEPERNAIRLGEELVIRGSVSGSRAPGEEIVTLKEDGNQVKQFTVATRTERRFEVRHRPKKKGMHVYSLELAAGDAVLQNNTARFTADVIEEKINVLLIEGFPRFEFKLFKTVLEVDPLVNLVSISHLPGGGVYVQGTPLHRNPQEGLIGSQEDLFKYDVIILRDVPRSNFREGGDTTESRLQHIVQFVSKRGGGLIVGGGQSVYRAGGYTDSHLAPILPFDQTSAISGEDQFEGMFFVTIPKPAYEHPLLQLLSDPRENRERLNSLRQLDGSNNVGRFKPLATPLMTRSVKVKGQAGAMIDRETPILASMNVGEGKVLAAAVDTLWRWQLQPDFDDPPLTMLLANAVRFLAPPPGRKPGAPNVNLGDAAPQVGQELLLSTDLKDKNFDPIQGADLVVTVTPPAGKPYRIYPRDLPEEPGHYAYRVALEHPGQHQITARLGKFESTREIYAGVAEGEFADLSVDRTGAMKLVKAGHGEMIAGSMDDWLAKADMGPSHPAAVRHLEIWNSPLVLLLFLGLVSADCYIRKRQGLA